VISINGLVRNYDKLLALGRLNLEVPSGELFRFIDLNGRGKTTTIKLLAAQLKPSSGTIHIDDIDIKQGRIRVKNHRLHPRPTLYLSKTNRLGITRIYRRTVLDETGCYTWKGRKVFHLF
jgi:ABC-type multidrug transport system ATPase subunit